MKTIKCKLSLYLLKIYGEQHNTLLYKMKLPRLFITTRDEIKGSRGNYFYVPSREEKYFKLITIFVIDQKILEKLSLSYDVFQFVANQWWKAEGYSSPEEMEEMLRKIYPNATALYVHVMKEVLLEHEN